MDLPFHHEHWIASLAVQRASLLTKKVLSTLHNSDSLSKSDSTPVTIADFAAQALLISAIHASFPSDAFVGEESADELRNDKELAQKVWELVENTRLSDDDSEKLLGRPVSLEDMERFIDMGGNGKGGDKGRIWILDPIDGTATFMKGQQYAVSLALVEDGKEVVGVLGCPNLNLDTGRVEEGSVTREMGLMLSAVKGQGAYQRLMGTGDLLACKKIEKSVNGPDDLKNLHFVDQTVSKAWSREKAQRVAERLGAAGPFPGTELWSSHVRYAALITGCGDALVRFPVKRNKISYVWDHAGAQLIYREVGGKITDLEGKEMDFGVGRQLSNNWGFIAAKENIHAKILELVTAVLKAE